MRVVRLLTLIGALFCCSVAAAGETRLDDPPVEGEAYVWYLGHAGWLVRTSQHCLIFDATGPFEEGDIRNRIAEIAGQQEAEVRENLSQVEQAQMIGDEAIRRMEARDAAAIPGGVAPDSVQSPIERIREISSAPTVRRGVAPVVPIKEP